METTVTLLGISLVIVAVLGIGYLMIARPDIPLRWQTWLQRTVMGAKYEPGPRTYTITRVVGGVLAVYMLFVLTAIWFGILQTDTQRNERVVSPPPEWEVRLARSDCEIRHGVWGNGECTIPIEEQIRVKEEELTCLKNGGTWGRTGISIREECNLPTNDGGKVCTDYSECEGTCVGKPGATSGVCTEWTVTKGCYAVLHNGKADEHALCAD